MKRFLPFVLLLCALLCAPLCAHAKTPGRIVIGTDKGAQDLQLSPDGRWLLSFSYDAAPKDGADARRNCAVWNVATRKLVRRVRADEVFWSGDSRLMLLSTVSEQNAPRHFFYRQDAMQIVEARSGRVIRTWKTPFRPDEIVGDARFENNGKTLRVATPFRVWKFDAKSGATLGRTNLQIQYQKDYQVSNPPNAQTFMDSGRRLLYENVGDIYVYDVQSGQRTRKLPLDDSLYSASNSKTVIQHDHENGEVTAYDFGSNRVLWRGRIAPGRPFLSPDGRLLLSAAKRVELFDARTGQQLKHQSLPAPLQWNDAGYETDPVYAIAPGNRAVFTIEKGALVRYPLR